MWENNVTISGGNGPYTLLWSSLDVDGFSSSLEDISGLSVGEYNLKVTDANGCVETISKKLDNSGRKSINSEWFVKDKFFTTVKSDETMSQDVNNIYSVSFINDNDGIAVGEYGSLSNNFVSYQLNTSDAASNHHYHIYDIEKGNIPNSGGEQVDIFYGQIGGGPPTNKNIIESFYFEDKKVLALAENYILTKPSSSTIGKGQWNSHFVNGTITSTHFISSTTGWISGRYNNEGFFFDEIRSISITDEGLSVEKTNEIENKILGIHSLKIRE